MKKIKNVFALLLCVLLSFQPLNTVSANSQESNDDVSNKVVAYDISDIEKQESSVGEQFTPTLPNTINVDLASIDEQGKENIIKEEVEVTWKELDGKEFHTNSEDIYTYQATFIDEAVILDKQLELPLVSVTVNKLDDFETDKQSSDEPENEPEEIIDTTKTKSNDIEIEEPKIENKSTNIAMSPRGTLSFATSPIEFGEGNPWNYVEYNGVYSYAIEVSYDSTIAAGQERTVIINADAFNIGISYPLEIGTRAESASFINAVSLSENKKVLTYTINNEELKSAPGIITFTLKSTNYFAKGFYTTDYYKPSTLASNIGVMLLNNPNARMGISLTSGSDASETVTLEHVLKRDNHEVLPLVEKHYISSAYGSVQSGKSLNQLYLGSDGYLYYRNTSGTNLYVGTINTASKTLISAPVYYYRLNLVDEDHAPIGDPKFEFKVPSGFNFVDYNTYVPEYSTNSTLAVARVNSVEDSFSGTSSQITSIISTTLSSNARQMLTGIAPANTQGYVMYAITGNGVTSIRANQPLHTYTEESYTSDEATNVNYNVVTIDATTGEYVVEPREEQFDTMSIHIPEYTYEDMISMEASVPEKVNDEDPDDTKYNFSIFNNVTSDINSAGEKEYTNQFVSQNRAPYFHNDGTMTMEFNDPDFVPRTLVLPNSQGEFTGYQIFYSDGHTENVNVIGEITIDFNKRSTTIDKIVFNISSRGLIERGKASGYETPGYFQGDFIKPEPGEPNSIKVDVLFESKGNGPDSLLPGAKVEAPKEITWEYEETSDYLHLYQETMIRENLILNEDWSDLPSIDIGIAMPMEARQSSTSYRNVRIDLFSTTYPGADVEATKALLAQVNSRFSFYPKSSIYTFVEDSNSKVWFEYRTNKNNDVRVHNVNLDSTTVSIRLESDEYLTELVLCSDYLKLYGADTEYKDSGFDAEAFIKEIELSRTRKTDISAIDHNEQVEIRSTITADGLTNTWIPSVGEQPEVSKNKNISYHYNNQYGSNGSNITVVKYLDVHLNTTGSSGGIELPSTATEGLTLGDIPSAKISVILPVTNNAKSQGHDGNLFYPFGTKAYLELNTQQYKYIGDDPQVEIIKENGKTWLVYELYTADMTGQASDDLRLTPSDFLVVGDILPHESYPLFLDGYMDIGNLVIQNRDVDPFIDYIPGETIETHGLEDVYGFKGHSHVEYDGKRFVQIHNINKEIAIESAENSGLQIYPGIEGKTTPVETVTYDARQHNQLILNTQIGSNKDQYTNYHLVVELPRDKIESATSTPEKQEISNLSLYVRSLDPSNVVVSNNITAPYTVQYASAYEFDKENHINSVLKSVTTATSVEEARYVIISFSEIPVSTFVDIDIKLQAKENDMYKSAHESISYATINGRFEYKLASSGSAIATVGESQVARSAKYIFSWYEVKGTVFEDVYSYSLIDGLYFPQDKGFDNTEFTFDNFATLDAQGKPEQLQALVTSKASYFQATGYSLFIQPRETKDNTPDYIIAINKETLMPSYEPGEDVVFNNALNASDYTNLTMLNRNNNAPISGGIEIIANANTFEIISSTETGVPHVTQYEIDNGHIDFAVTRNPTVEITPNITSVKVGETITLELEIIGAGTFKEGQIYNPVDGETYGKATVTATNPVTNSATIVLEGVDITVNPDTGELIFKDAITTIYNHLGEEINVTSKYSVYADPFVTFYDYDKDKVDVIGKWNDTTITTNNIPEVIEQDPNNLYNGLLDNTKVPLITSPQNYIFAGWQTHAGEMVPFSGDVTSLVKFEKLYPIFEEDFLVDSDEDLNGDMPGDGIPDKYQTTVKHIVTNGTWSPNITETTEVVTFKKGDQPSNDIDATASFIKPTGTQNLGYDSGAWTSVEPTGTLVFTVDEVTYTYEYQPIIPTVTQAVTNPGGIHPDTDAVTVEKDTPVTLTATGNSKGATESELTYQWYEKDATGKLVEIPGATNITYIPSTNTLGQTLYVVVVTDTRNNQTATSEVSTVTVETMYDVIFEENGGSEVPDQTLKPGDKIIEPPMPTKPGHTFVGWYLDPQLTQKFDFNTPMPEGNLTLYAKYEVSTPSTGDNTQIILWIGIMTVTVLGLIGYRKTKKNEK